MRIRGVAVLLLLAAALPPMVAVAAPAKIALMWRSAAALPQPPSST